jgi:sigma-B regulation protein RsbU (phosphoserine phosphatase)
MGMFTTAFCAIIYQYDKRILFSSAGHNDQMLIKKSGDILRLKTSGKPLGIFEDVFFEQREIYYNKGDLLVLFTDGIAEALGGMILMLTEAFLSLQILIKIF